MILKLPKSRYFAKRAIRILGDGGEIQSRPDLDDQIDYEVELAVIIGRRGKDIPKEEAENYIFGYSVFNDISSRRLQNQHGQWFKGKSLDTYTAMGPVILHKSALPFPVEADVRSYVNNEKRQDSNTRFFLTDLPQIIEDLSRGMTLEPGDIIATGTPAGVGMGFRPPRFMKAGDCVTCEIPPIGTLTNYII
ncbi:MAG: fumarylacetoacetate hydrolase family protein [Eisenbergiella massiliensis]